MRKVWLVLFSLILGLFFIGKTAGAADLSALPQDVQDLITQLLDTRFPPELKGYKLSPAEPVAGQPTKITVDISNDASVTSDTTSGVTVYYMVNWTEPWQSIELESGDSKSWTGELPAFNSGDEVVFAIRAIDSSTNVFSTIPCKVIPEEEILTAKHLNDCTKVASPDVSACVDDLKPHGCLMRISADEDPLDDEDAKIPVDSDYVDYRVGYDDNYIYLDLTVQGKIYQGTMNPIDIRAYASLILNPDKIGKIKNLDALLAAGGGAVLLYAPLADMAGGLVKSCALIYMKGKEAVQDDKAVQCKTKNNHLVYKIKKSALPAAIGANSSSIYHFFSVTAAITNFPSPVEGKPYDYSHISAAHFTEDTYFQVK